MSEIKSKRPWVIIGTSGSTDYLKDTSGDRRYWPVSVSTVDIPSATPEDLAVVQRLVEATSGKWLVEAGEVCDGLCDGLHDEGAPVLYLCSRCFSDRGDLVDSQDNEYQCDEEEEIN